MKPKSKRRLWWLSLSPSEKGRYVKSKMAAKAAIRTPEWRRKRYLSRGYSEQEIDFIMKGYQDDKDVSIHDR
jgi:hypothetical protein